MRLSRRALIKDGLLVVSAGMVMPAIFSRGVASAKTLAGEGAHFAQAAAERTLIVVQMAGGNDGLNTVVPITDSLYYQMRRRWLSRRARRCHWMAAWGCTPT